MLEAAEPFDGCCNTPDVLKAALQWLVDELSKSEGMSPMLNGTYQDGWNGAWRHILRFLAPGSDADILMEILPAPIHLTCPPMKSWLTIEESTLTAQSAVQMSQVLHLYLGRTPAQSLPNGQAPLMGSSQLERRIGESTEADSIAGRIVSMSDFA